jgi:hypothetical protein
MLHKRDSTSMFMIMRGMHCDASPVPEYPIRRKEQSVVSSQKKKTHGRYSEKTRRTLIEGKEHQKKNVLLRPALRVVLL